MSSSDFFRQVPVLKTSIRRLRPEAYSHTQIKEIKAGLNMYGFCVVKIMETSEAEQLRDEIFNFIQDVAPGADSRTDKDNWIAQSGGVVNMYGIGQSVPMWEIRTHPNMLAVQRGLNGVGPEEPMICSFDGVNIGQAGSEYNDSLTFRPWPHLDQNIKRLDHFETYQGGLCLTNNFGPYEGGFVCYPYALNNKWNSIYPEIKASSKDWLKFPNDKCHTSLRPEEAFVIEMEAGCAVFWDSRLPHCAVRPGPAAKNDRVVAYVCMLPRSRATPRQLNRRRKLFLRRHTTSHHPSRGQIINPSLHNMRKTIKFSPIQHAKKPRPALEKLVSEELYQAILKLV